MNEIIGIWRRVGGRNSIIYGSLGREKERGFWGNYDCVCVLLTRKYEVRIEAMHSFCVVVIIPQLQSILGLSFPGLLTVRIYVREISF